MSTEIEKLKAYHQIESFLDKETKEMLIEKLKLENSNLKERLPGLRIEDEFALILYFLGNCKHILSLDETTSLLTQNSYQSDFIVCFKDNQKIMVEIKSTSKNKFKISKSNFEKKILFANDMNIDLYFAIKMHGQWSLFHSNYLKENNFIIRYNNHYKDSILLETLKSFLIVIPSNITIKSTYSSKKNFLGPSHSDFGGLVKYEIEYNQEPILIQDKDNQKYIHIIFILELWHDILSTNLEVTQLNSTEVMVIEKSDKNIFTFDFQYFISCIHHTIDNYDERYHTSSFLKNMVENIDIALTQEMILQTISDLQKLGIPIIMANTMSKIDPKSINF